MSRDKSHQLNILVIGANGGVGLQVVRTALSQGHSVTALVRNPDKLSVSHDQLVVIKGDILDPVSIRNAFDNMDVVISAIGSNSRRPTTLYSKGARNIVEAMTRSDVTRCFFISASGLEVNPSFNFFLTWMTRNILQRILKEMYADLIDMESLVKRTSLNWTIMRPPRLTNGRATGQCRFSVDKYLDQGMQISRSDLAHFMLDNVYNAVIYRKTVEVGY